MKRCLDVVTALAGLVMLLPLLIAVAIVVYKAFGRPILFRQTRPGLDERPYEVVKFRTMLSHTDASGALLDDAQRLTNTGRFLRKLSLDELPSLWNVLKGDMSLVGPRPLLMRYLPYFTDTERKRFAMRPGITGWAQVRGRNHATWNQRLADDVWYVENWSLWLDIRILLRTVWQVFRSSGVETDPTSVMKDFDVERRQR